MPASPLRKYIAKMWLFESSGKMPADDMKLVVPNGNLKLTVSYQNGIVAAINGREFVSRQQDITLTGLINVPVFLDAENDVPTETIGIEFHPQGAYRFFHFSLKDIQNQIYPISDLLGNPGRQLVERVNEAGSAAQKILVLQQFLLQQLALHEEDSVFEYCIEQIMSTRGKITVKELERKTGYTSRWLNVKFQDCLGVSPKNLSSVIRFSHYYQSLLGAGPLPFSTHDFYDLYYDQSHFIKHFERFTGLSPKSFERQINHFGERYYR